MAVAGLLVLGGLAALAQERDVFARAEGIFLSGEDDSPTVAKFNVLLNRGGRERVVESNHRFQDGDRMQFRFEINRDAYVWILHRSFAGQPDSDRVRRYAGPKGIDVVRDENRRRERFPDRDRGRSGRGESTYHLLFPSERTGRDNRLKARRTYTVPSDRNTFFTMDNNPGIEKLYLVVSEERLDIADHFDLSDGRMRRRESSGSGRRDDSESDVLDRLTARLADFGGNVELGFSKGLGVEVDGYGIGVARDRPLMVEVDLAHDSR